MLRVKLSMGLTLTLVAYSIGVSNIALAVDLLNPDRYRSSPLAPVDVFYVPPQLLRPSEDCMVRVRGLDLSSVPPGTSVNGSSGVAVAGNWVLSAKHVQGNEPDYYVNPVWHGGTKYKIASPPIEHPTEDLVLLQLVDWNTNAPANLPHVDIDPSLAIRQGDVVTQGGFGRKQMRDATGAELPGQFFHFPGILSWGRNYITTIDNTAINYSSSVAEEVAFQGKTDVGDSGGGYFVRDGWDWRLIATTLVVNVGHAVSDSAIYSWIDQAIGGLPQPTSAPKPSSTILWGGGTGSWHSAANWEDTTTHQQRVPGYDNTHFDAVQIVSTGDGPTITSTATAREIFIGVASANYSQMTVKSGGSLSANTIFAGADVGEKGVMSQLGGTVTAEIEYVGYRGAIGGYFHQSGSNSTFALYIGEDNSATDLAAYQMQGNISPFGRPVLNTKKLEIGGGVGSNGVLLIEQGNGTLADVNVQYHAVVGSRGHGQAVQEIGNVAAGVLVLGEFSTSIGEYTLEGGALTTGTSVIGADGDAEFLQSGGTHTTNTLNIGENGNYAISGGSLKAKIVEQDGTLTISGGSIAVNRLIGEVDFANSAGTIRGEGIVDLRNATFLNASNANLLVDEDALVLFSDANPFQTTQMGGLTHQVGSTLSVSGVGFRATMGGILGNTLLTDHVEFTDGGFANVSGDGRLGFLQGAHVHSTSAAPITGSLSSGVGSLDFASNASHKGLEVDTGATLRADGNFDFGTVGIFNVAGRLEIGGGLGTATTAQLKVNSDDALGSTPQFELTSSADLVINVDRSTSTLMFDSIDVEKGIASLSGNLSIVELAGFEAAPQEEFTILTTDYSRLQGKFASITLDDGVSSTSGILTDTSGGLAAYAVTYSNVGVDVRISLPGDFNFDNFVNASDSAILLSHYYMTGATWAEGDANGDGMVGAADYAVYLANIWRSWPSLQAVPEPASLGMFFATGAAIFAAQRGRRRTV